MSVRIPLDRVSDSPWQTRQSYDDAYIAELAADIGRNGLLQAPVGRLVGAGGAPITLDGFYLGSDKAAEMIWEDFPEAAAQIAFGHNRLRALRRLAEAGGEHTIPVELRPLTDEEMARLAWTENEQRKDLTPVEEALAIKRRMDDFGWTQAEVAEQLSLARSTVANKLRILQLPEEVLDQVRSGALPERTAVALVTLHALPDVVQEQVRKNWRFKEVEKDLTAHTSDQVRVAIDQATQNESRPLDGKEFDPDHVFALVPGNDDTRIRQETCTGCDLRFSHKGDRCAGPICYAAKAKRWHLLQVEAAAEKRGLPVISSAGREWSSYSHFSNYGEEGKKALKRALEVGVHGSAPCERLGLDPDQTWQLSPKDVKASYICKHGGKGCACANAIKRAEKKEEAERTAAVERIKAHVAAQVAVLFEGVSAKAALLLDGRHNGYARLVPVEQGELTTEELLLDLARAGVSRAVSWKGGKDPAECLKELTAWSEMWKLDLEVRDPGPPADDAAPAAGEGDGTAEPHVVKLQSRRQQVAGAQQPKLSAREKEVLGLASEQPSGTTFAAFRASLDERQQGCLGRLLQLGHLGRHTHNDALVVRLAAEADGIAEEPILEEA